MRYKHLTDSQVTEIKQTIHENDDVSDVVNLFKVLGDQTRLRILLALFDHELCVHDICKVIEVSQSAVSHQLRNLREAKLVKYRREGKEVIYSLDDEHVKEIYGLGLNHILDLR